ncbi:MAG: hypothetical protein ACI4QG_00815 [Candidatus Cryptobacteroides sp.]
MVKKTECDNLRYGMWQIRKYKSPSSRSKPLEFNAKEGKWLGAKFGFFCNRHSPKNDGGWLRVDWVKVEQ